MATRIRKPDPLEPLRSELQIVTAEDMGDLSSRFDAAIRAAVRAVVPGRQKGKNLEPLWAAARAAFVRTLRRHRRMA